MTRGALYVRSRDLSEIGYLFYNHFGVHLVVLSER